MVVLAGCGGGGHSGVTTSTTPHLLGKASAGQRRRAQAYTRCLRKSRKKLRLTVRRGTSQSPPVILGRIRGTRFGINLSASPAGAKRIEQKLRKSGNKALYRRGSTVVAFAGRHPTPAGVAMVTACADRLR
jgi:hypothetical protein